MKTAIKIDRDDNFLQICKYAFPDDYPMDITKHHILISVEHNKPESLSPINTNVISNTILNMCDRLQAHIYIHKGLSMLPNGNAQSRTHYIKIDKLHKELLQLLIQGK